MKRSEMVAKIIDALDHYVCDEYDWVPEASSIVLKIIEEAGMLPPYEPLEDHVGQLAGYETIYGCTWDKDEKN